MRKARINPRAPNVGDGSGSMKTNRIVGTAASAPKLTQTKSAPKSSNLVGAPHGSLKVRKIGNSLGVVLPREMLARLNAGEGDEVQVSETESGLHLHRQDAEFEEHMKQVEKIMARYPNTLRALAK